MTAFRHAMIALKVVLWFALTVTVLADGRQTFAELHSLITNREFGRALALSIHHSSQRAGKGLWSPGNCGVEQVQSLAMAHPGYLRGPSLNKTVRERLLENEKTQCHSLRRYGYYQVQLLVSRELQRVAEVDDVCRKAFAALSAQGDFLVNCFNPWPFPAPDFEVHITPALDRCFSNISLALSEHKTNRTNATLTLLAAARDCTNSGEDTEVERNRLRLVFPHYYNHGDQSGSDATRRMQAHNVLQSAAQDAESVPSSVATVVFSGAAVVVIVVGGLIVRRGRYIHPFVDEVECHGHCNPKTNAFFVARTRCWHTTEWHWVKFHHGNTTPCVVQCDHPTLHRPLASSTYHDCHQLVRECIERHPGEGHLVISQDVSVRIGSHFHTPFPVGGYAPTTPPVEANGVDVR